jgi:hypothetical protein
MLREPLYTAQPAATDGTATLEARHETPEAEKVNR